MHGSPSVVRYLEGQVDDIETTLAGKLLEVDFDILESQFHAVTRLVDHTATQTLSPDLASRLATIRERLDEASAEFASR